MTRTGQVEISGEVLPRMREAGYTVDIVAQAAHQGFRLIVRPEFGSASTYSGYTVHRVGWEFCPWHDAWWARFFRWLGGKHWRIANLFPDWLRWLYYAKQPTQTSETKSLPGDFLDRIRAQRYELWLRGEDPSMVVCGRRALYELRGHPDLWDAKFTYGPRPMDQSIWGMKIVLSPWLDDDAVVVV